MSRPFRAAGFIRSTQGDARQARSALGCHVIVKCGPPLGHKHAGHAVNYGAGHVHPDAGHFILAGGGEVLFRDSGYCAPKLTGNHSVLLVEGKGQKGEGKTWFRFGDWVKDRHAPRVRSFESGPAVDVIDCEVAPAYPLEVGLKRFDRTFEFDRENQLVIRDVVQTADPAALEWRLQVEGSLRRVSDTEWITTKGDVSASIRVDASVPVVLSGKTLEINQHIRATEREYHSIRTTDKVSDATLNTVIEVHPQN